MNKFDQVLDKAKCHPHIQAGAQVEKEMGADERASVENRSVARKPTPNSQSN
jgi:hypothetical protein